MISKRELTENKLRAQTILISTTTRGEGLSEHQSLPQ